MTTARQQAEFLVRRYVQGLKGDPLADKDVLLVYDIHSYLTDIIRDNSELDEYDYTYLYGRALDELHK